MKRFFDHSVRNKHKYKTNAFDRINIYWTKNVTDRTYKKLLSDYITKEKPELFCFTSVSSQYWLVNKIAEEVKNIDPNIFTILASTR